MNADVLAAGQIEAICARFDLGAPIRPPQSITGGLLHRLWRFTTRRGDFAVKRLNPTIARRPGIRTIYTQTEQIAALLATRGIAAPIALDPGDGPVQVIDTATFLAYPWISGETLPGGAALPPRARQIGRVLGVIHHQRLDFPELSPLHVQYFLEADWAGLVDRASNDRLPWGERPAAVLVELREWSALHDDTFPARQADLVVSHRDLDQKNVLWRDATSPVLIDWEGAGWINPAQEVVSAALDWSGQSVGPPQRATLAALLDGYREVCDLAPGMGRTALAGVIGNWLGWLWFNMERSLGADGADPAERAIGLRETHQTLATLRLLTANLETWAAWFDSDA